MSPCRPKRRRLDPYSNFGPSSGRAAQRMMCGAGQDVDMPRHQGNEGTDLEMMERRVSEHGATNIRMCVGRP